MDVISFLMSYKLLKCLRSIFYIETCFSRKRGCSTVVAHHPALPPSRYCYPKGLVLRSQEKKWGKNIIEKQQQMFYKMSSFFNNVDRTFFRSTHTFCSSSKFVETSCTGDNHTPAQGVRTRATEVPSQKIWIESFVSRTDGILL